MARYEIDIREVRPKKEPGCLSYLVVAFIILCLIMAAGK